MGGGGVLWEKKGSVEDDGNNNFKMISLKKKMIFLFIFLKRSLL